MHKPMTLVQRLCRSLLAGMAVCLAFLLSGWASAAAPSESVPQPDGPYVVRSADGGWEAWSVEVTPAGAQKRARTVKPGDKIDIPSIGRVPGFRVTLRPAAIVQADERKVPAGAPFFVVADTHGEYEILIELLRMHRVVDARLRWLFGRGQLVFLGDVFDRGPNQTEILWLIYQLEAEAAKAGGGVHFVLGNHEAMVLRGDVRYLNPKYGRTAEILGVESYSLLFPPDSVLGQWVRTKPAVLKLNDLLCLHGGISQDVVKRKLTLSQLNATVRDAVSGIPLGETGQERAQFVMGPLGPLWYRGYFAEQQDFPITTSDDVDHIRQHFGVSTILVGHTMVPTVTALHDGRVIAVQVYPRRDEKNGQPIMEALRIENGRFLRAKIDGTLESLET